MSDYQFRSLSATGWLCVSVASDSIYAVALATCFVLAYSVGAVIAIHKEGKQ